MNIEGTAAIITNFALIGALPFIFFKRNGPLTPAWFATAAPLVASVGSVVAVQFQMISLPSFMTPLWSHGLPNVLSMLLSLGSIALIAFTLGTHRIPVALWHQTDDPPEHIVTWGAYSRIRHPFYSSFVLALLSAFLYCPQAITAATLVIGALALNATAAREEERLSVSAFGQEYKNYITRTGRFIPRWSA